MRRTLPGLVMPLLLFVLGVAAVRLTSPARIVISWETASEVETAGFFLYRCRSQEGPFALLDEAPLLAQGDPLAGTSYRYEDRDVAWGQRYFYRLEEVERDGGRNRYPEVVEGQAGLGWSWALACGLLLAALAAGWLWVGRRRTIPAPLEHRAIDD
jgi:hypothetical protein